MRVRLEDVCEKGSSKLKQSNVIDQNGLYPVYGASGYLGNVNTYQQSNYYVAVVKDGAGIGRTMLLPPKSSIIGTMQYLIPKDNVLPEYLYYVVKAKHLEKYFSGATIPHIYFKDYKNEQFDLVSFEEQREIINRIKKIEIIIDDLSKTLALLDELVRARFVEMFGEYETSVKLSRYIKELRAGKSLAGKTKCKNKVLKTGAATFGFFDKEQYKYYPIDYVPNPLHRVEDGDVIISRMNTPELVGSCSYVFEAPEDMYYPDRLWKTIITEDTNPIFLWQLMWQQDIRKQIKENSFGTSGTMNNISKVKLLNIKAIDVPLELQEEYASFVEEIDKSRLLNIHSLSLIKSITF